MTIHLGGRDEEQIRVKRAKARGMTTRGMMTRAHALCVRPQLLVIRSKRVERENLSKSGLDITRVFVLTWGGASQVFKQRTYRVNRVSDDA